MEEFQVSSVSMLPVCLIMNLQPLFIGYNLPCLGIGDRYKPVINSISSAALDLGIVTNVGSGPAAIPSTWDDPDSFMLALGIRVNGATTTASDTITVYNDNVQVATTSVTEYAANPSVIDAVPTLTYFGPFDRVTQGIKKDVQYHYVLEVSLIRNAYIVV